MKKFLLSLVAMFAFTAAFASETSMDMTELGSGWSSEYNADDQSITYSGAWAGRGWWLGDVDYSDYDGFQIVFYTEATDYMQIQIEYNDGTSQSEGLNCAGDISTAETMTAYFTDSKSSVKQIYIQCQNSGTVIYIEKAVLFTEDGEEAAEDTTEDTTEDSASTSGFEAYTVGETDCSTGWWSAWSDSYKVADGETHITYFKNYTNGTYNWNNWVIAFVNVGDNIHGASELDTYSEYLVLRADNYGWGTYYDDSNLSNDYAWDDGTETWTYFPTLMDGANVALAVSVNDGVVTMTAYTQSQDGTLYTYSYNFTVEGLEEVYYFLTTEGGYLDIANAGTATEKELGFAVDAYPWNYTVSTSGAIDVNFTSQWGEFKLIEGTIAAGSVVVIDVADVPTATFTDDEGEEYEDSAVQIKIAYASGDSYPSLETGLNTITLEEDATLVEIQGKVAGVAASINGVTLDGVAQAYAGTSWGCTYNTMAPATANFTGQWGGIALYNPETAAADTFTYGEAAVAIYTLEFEAATNISTMVEFDKTSGGIIWNHAEAGATSLTAPIFDAMITVAGYTDDITTVYFKATDESNYPDAITVTSIKALVLEASEDSSYDPSVDEVEEAEEEDGIESISANTNTVNGMFNIAGQRVNSLTKGLYIVNGKKVMVK